MKIHTSNLQDMIVNYSILEGFVIYNFGKVGFLFCSPLNMASFVSDVCNMAAFQTAVYCSPSATP